MRKVQSAPTTVLSDTGRDRGFDLARLRFPPCRHNLKLISRMQESGADGQASFETITTALEEKKNRLRQLDEWVRMAELAGSEHSTQASDCYTPDVAADLGTRLRSAKGVESAETFACPLFARAFRIRFYGAVSRLSQNYAPDDLQLFTLIPQLPGWRVAGSDLGKVKPRLLLQRLRQQLVREGECEAGGWLVASLHGDYDPTEDIYQLHIHGLGAGSGPNLVRGMKRLPCYRRRVTDEAAYMPHKMYRWTGGARQGSYHLAQLIWPSRATFVNADGRERRARDRRRIPAPRYAEFLMWLDRLSFQDLVLLYGCRVSGGLLKPTIP